MYFFLVNYSPHIDLMVTMWYIPGEVIVMIQENQPTCKDCKHFIRHYVRFPSGRYHAISHGHCTHPRVKPRTMEFPACPHFQPRCPE